MYVMCGGGGGSLVKRERERERGRGRERSILSSANSSALLASRHQSVSSCSVQWLAVVVCV